MNLKSIQILIITCLITIPSFAQQGFNPSEVDPEYTNVLINRVDKFLKGLGIENQYKYEQVRAIVVRQYQTINWLEEERNAKVKTLRNQTQMDKALINAKIDLVKSHHQLEVFQMHTQYIAQLQTELAAEQVDLVKDGMTYGVLERTYNGYTNLLPQLTEEQKKHIRVNLITARELAMDKGSSDEKHATFGKYKGRINNYLSAQGYDLKKAEMVLKEKEKVTLPPAQNLELHYDEPAKKWTEALPVGNGRLGAMVYGGVEQEHIQFNEETLWTGGPHDYSNKGSHQYLEPIRALLWEGKQDEAEELASKHFMSDPLRLKAYQPFGDLILNFDHNKPPLNYKRKLDLKNAVAEVSYNVNGVHFKREVIASYPDQLIAVHLTANQEGALNFSFGLDSKHQLKSVQTDSDRQVLSVKVLGGEMEGKAMLLVKTDGEIDPAYDVIAVKNASSATLYLAAHTNFVNFQDVSRPASRYIDRSFRKFNDLSYQEVKEKHLQDYHQLFKRFKIELDSTEYSSLPTDERIFSFWKNANDPQLLALYVQYGRYLTIASSRPGTQPANLQGIWNDRLEPSWDSKWTTNINCEMNYWPVEIANLPECHEPLFRLIEECAETGSIVAKEHYDADGWVLHHNTDIWRATAPVNASNHGIWASGGAWLCHHLWEHFLFTQDTAFLKEKYPLIKGAALFFKDFLVEDPKTGHLVSTPSNSPELGGLVAGPTMDHQIVRSLFDIIIQAAGILQIDGELAKELAIMRSNILPNQIGKHGQLQEWMVDIDDPNEKHRHVSHLWGLHPGKEINWLESPELVKAAKQTLAFRGDEGTGWSLAWKINFWARLLDGNYAFNLIHMLLSPAETKGRNTRGGSYPNLFDAHPPFQIDGNFGGAAGIIELLVQSQHGFIDILPALPDQLLNGNLEGVCARGGFELDFSWSNGKLIELKVFSKAGNKCVLKYGNHWIDFQTQKGKTYIFDQALKKKG